MANDPALRARRDTVVREHIAAENAADLDRVLATFRRRRYDLVPMGAAFEGEVAVRALVGAFADFCFTPSTIHHADDAVIVEARMTGIHRAAWAGLAPRGNRLDLPLVCIFDFEGADLVNEKVFFDFAAVQRQLTTEGGRS